MPERAPIMSPAPANTFTGFLAVDKSPGWTSHDVVARIRRLSGVRRVGHAGTLDPFATGLLIVGVGKATRLIQYVQNADKSYVTTLKLGEESDTFDIEGEITNRSNIEAWPAIEEIAAILERYVGTIEQIPPAHSAIHIDGRRAYELARSGEKIDIPARTVTIHSLEVINYAPPFLQLSVRCSTGTYIRSLARDIGRDLGTYAFCQELRRTAIGTFSVDDANQIDDLDPETFGERWNEAALPPDSVVLGFDAVSLNNEQSTAWYHGQPLRDVDVTPSGTTDTMVRVYTAAGDFAGLGRIDAAGELRPVLVFKAD